jgi:dCTP deaminase
LEAGINEVAATGAVLSRESLKKRLGNDLIISPLLEQSQIGDGSIDISLGTRFITSQRSQFTKIDPIELSETQIRIFQRATVTPFGGKFVLHPNSFALGCTFEFIALPLDLCGFVLSRSAYGRAGLLIATATYVHPGWHGCLTLELENLGEVPIILRPLSTVGQLVLMSTQKLSEIPKFKTIPVGPAYSSLSHDPRWDKIRKIQARLSPSSQ